MLSPHKTHPFWRTGTRYNAKGRLGPASPTGLRSLLLGFNYIIPQPGMAPFTRRNIGGTTRTGPKGDRKETEGGPKGTEGLKLYLPKFFSFPHHLGLSQDAFQGRPKRTAGGPKGDRRHALCWCLAHLVDMSCVMTYCKLRAWTSRTNTSLRPKSCKVCSFVRLHCFYFQQRQS